VLTATKRQIKKNKIGQISSLRRVSYIICTMHALCISGLCGYGYGQAPVLFSLIPIAVIIGLMKGIRSKLLQWYSNWIRSKTENVLVRCSVVRRMMNHYVFCQHFRCF